MSTTTLLQYIFMLSYKDRIYVAEQIMHSLQAADMPDNTALIADNKKLEAAKTYTIDEAFQMVEDELNRHYGTNLKIV